MFVCSCGSTGNSARNNSATEDPGNEKASQQQFRLFGNGELMAWRVYMTLFQESIQWWTKIQVSCLGYYSLRSKRFQSSYCAYVRARAIKRWKGEEGGGREKSFLLSCPPPPSFLFLLSSQLSRRTRAETLATQARAVILLSFQKGGMLVIKALTVLLPTKPVMSNTAAL